MHSSQGRNLGRVFCRDPGPGGAFPPAAGWRDLDAPSLYGHARLINQSNQETMKRNDVWVHAATQMNPKTLCMEENAGHNRPLVIGFQSQARPRAAEP